MRKPTDGLVWRMCTLHHLSLSLLFLVPLLLLFLQRVLIYEIPPGTSHPFFSFYAEAEEEEFFPLRGKILLTSAHEAFFRGRSEREQQALVALATTTTVVT